MALVYILFSKKTKKFYTGSCRNDDISLRLKEHNAGRTRSTKSGRPWIVVYQEKVLDYTSARRRELFLKSGMGRGWVCERFGSYKLESCQSG